ncbi:MAG: rRNA cytosine-C5-methylase [Micavibrio aeruginosavorus]|uniref:rRNA cytosine-C5-methylase n=1 Tax=Micavibrio aeruginosavorus TaxID=349221 RepID=A0A2W5N068_9BACT|nr:MAG: rRNA cytosine-C5-methylase [Micavibrio aeruginosavorus]
MREPARITAAIDLLNRFKAAPIPMDNTIRDFMAARRFIGSKDRTSIVERVYRIMRSHARLGWWIAQGKMEDTSRLRVLADYVLNDRPEELESIFSGEQYAPDPLSDAEYDFADFLKNKELSDPAMPVAVRCECPDWAAEKLQPLFGDAFEAHLAAMIDPAPLDLRVNTVKGTVEEAIESLTKDHVRIERTKYSPIALRAKGKPFMGDTKAFKNGLVEIQDEGSQLIGLVSGAKPGMRVLDFCAGGGGKTLVLAAMMKNKGNIVATDNNTRRLEKGKPRFKKAGVHNVELRSLEEESNRKWLRRQKGTMDIVLVDAPCSSSGTWRRNPDLRWSWYGPKLPEIMQMQSDILDRVADKVKPGGRLVYATCSLFTEENEQQVESFLSRHADYSVLPFSEAWEGDTSMLPNEGPYLRLFPKDHETDGFFAAVLVKHNA